MKEIKLYLDLEKIEKETGRKFDVEGEYSDNFLQWIQYLAWCIATGSADEKAEELKDILDNCYSSVETREKLRQINIGRKLSKEIKDKISKNMIKNNCKIRNKNTGEVFDTVRIASQQTGISKSCIYSACKGKIRTAGGFEWEYVN